MRTRCRRSVAPIRSTIIVAVVASARLAAAGPVRFDGGEVRLTAGEAPPMTFPLSFPDAGGHSARADSAFAGETRVDFDLHEVPGGAVFDVAHDDSGDTRSAFTVSFTTDRELHFRLFAEPRPSSFSARFNGLVADAFYNPRAADLSGVYRGSLVHFDEETAKPDGFEARLFEGELPAGAYTFVVESSGGVDRQTVVDGGGAARLTLETAVNAAVPLPPAAWPTLLTLAATGAARLLRFHNVPGRRVSRRTQRPRDD
jgi:hypothetical protein